MIKTISRFVIIALYVLIGAPAMALEEPQYKLLLTIDDVEFRAYEPYIVAGVTVSREDADRQAFQILAGYIFGGNKSGEKMAMTTPVETRGNDYAFVMERKYSMETLPEPQDDRVHLRHQPARIVAVRRFSGRWTERNIGRHEQQLLADLASLGVETTGQPELARYNSPFTPWFLRRNEIIVPVNWQSVDPGAAIASESPARL